MEQVGNAYSSENHTLMTNLEIIRHNDILFRDLLRAVTVKNVAWPHSVESQVKWIIDNMQPDDMHVFLKENGEDKAYMTLSPVTATVNGVETPFMGVGCVCAAERGIGLGNSLMESVNKWLVEHGHKGLLFCKQGLIKFYSKHGWKVIEPANVLFETQHDGVFTMSYNCGEIVKMEYSDRLF